MLTPKLPESQKSLVARPQPVEIVAAEGAGKPIAFVLPPLEDMAEMEGLRLENFSIHEHVSADEEFNREAFAHAYTQLREKKEEFSSSPVFLSKLSTLANLAGRYFDEGNILTEIRGMSNASHYAHKLGHYILEHKGAHQAETFFRGMELEQDALANLRLASFCVQRREMEQAEVFVNQALVIDPLDFSARLFDGALHLINHRYPLAIRSFRIAMQERPTSSVVYCNIAVAYSKLGQFDKALSALKRSVALDPLNANALNLLADVAFFNKKDDDAIPALRFFLQLEQKNAGMWSRLARACLRIGKAEEAIVALKRQGSIEDTGAVWNNLGIAYLKMGDKKRALESFNHAMVLGKVAAERGYYLAAKNMAQLIASQNKIGLLHDFTLNILREGDDSIVRDVQSSEVVILYVYSLLKKGRSEDAIASCYHFLEQPDIADSLAVWLVSTLISIYALNADGDEIDGLLTKFRIDRKSLSSVDPQVRERYYNNVAFALAELGRADAAGRCLREIGHALHKSAYPTATFGLIQFRKGRVDRGAQLYEEAISLATTKEDKTRIRQKLNFELGHHWLFSNPSKARRLLERVAEEKYGESILAKRAARLLRAKGGGLGSR